MKLKLTKKSLTNISGFCLSPNLLNQCCALQKQSVFKTICVNKEPSFALKACLDLPLAHHPLRFQTHKTEQRVKNPLTSIICDTVPLKTENFVLYPLLHGQWRWLRVRHVSTSPRWIDNGGFSSTLPLPVFGRPQLSTPGIYPSKKLRGFIQ